MAGKPNQRLPNPTSHSSLSISCPALPCPAGEASCRSIHWLCASLGLNPPLLRAPRYPSMAPSYRPYSGEYQYGNGNAVVPYGGGGERRMKAVCRWVPGAWWLSDPEMKRRRRVAGYKSYAVEGKVKASIRRGLRWIKAKCSHIVRR